MEDRTFRNAMGRFATGVTVITVNEDEETRGMTANAFMSVSLDPKLVLISIDNRATMLDKLKGAESFGISLLTEEQKYLSMHFAKQKTYEGEILFDVIDEVPVLRNSLAALICKNYQQIPAGDHTLILGQVEEILFDDGEPLTFFKGQYGGIRSDAE
ncbi:flavin reductase family protein [Salinicoccus halodurans]|uniref:Flavin reductase n=1 Tax=Salinicoccus halodurans TaxID=407035 RepID=A0A0F7D506_9STAP|nr:flavin reductase family protein [Salinicoccus halodurans]AKG75150.1 flavin reductase [Salinicoccus halodurans]SFK66505.1 NADH-FMN oxidoreductase RutF, flavin reductase (DIM6/NTAB) family [Salinicoccus halodurans]